MATPCIQCLKEGRAVLSFKDNLCPDCYSYHLGGQFSQKYPDVEEDFLQLEAKQSPNPDQFLMAYYNNSNE
jgi:hypothetical protein